MQIKDYGNSVDIQYSEGQIFPLQLWNSHYINRFNTPEAINYFLEKSNQYTRKKLEAKVHSNFPSLLKRL